MSQPAKVTQKALNTRQRILDTALELFAGQGYEKTTMREIATRAECSLGLAYRYFASKDDLVLELYRSLVQQLEEQAGQLAAGTLADRFKQIIEAQFALMAPHYEMLGAVFGLALNPRSPTGVFSESTRELRHRSRTIYLKIVSGSKDAPHTAQVEDLATLLYGMQLALTFFWLQDLSQEKQKTHELITFVHDMLALLRPLLKLPMVSRSLARLAQIVGPMLGGWMPENSLTRDLYGGGQIADRGE